MLQPIFREENWCCFADSDSEFAKQLTSVHHARSLIEELQTSLKDNHRSCVKKGQMFNLEVVAKQPRDKNRRKWSRLLSLFREGEAKRMFQALELFEQYKINSLKPLFLLEERVFGVIVDSWIVYQFRDGIKSDKHALPQIIEILKRIHSNGHRHNDPNFGNFLRDENGDLFLIDCVLRQRIGSYTDTIDYLLLASINNGVSIEEVEQLVNPNRLLPGYWLAKCLIGYRSIRARIKAKLRPNRIKNN